MAGRDVNEVIDRLVSVSDDRSFHEAAERLKSDLCYKAPEEIWQWATFVVAPFLEDWRANNASWFYEAFEIWMDRPWQNGDPKPGDGLS